MKIVGKTCQLPDLVLFFCSNTIQFTHTQIEAIRAGMQPGLTMVRMFLSSVRMFLRILYSYLFNSGLRCIQWNTSNAPFCSLADVISVNISRIWKVNIQRFSVLQFSQNHTSNTSLYPVFQWQKAFHSNWICFCIRWIVFKESKNYFIAILCVDAYESFCSGVLNPEQIILRCFIYNTWIPLKCLRCQFWSVCGIDPMKTFTVAVCLYHQL